MTRHIIPLYPEKPAIIQSAEEHDRKECISLVRNADASTRKLAQWLLDNPRYSAPTVAGWIKDEETSYSERSLRKLREWASGGFVGAPFNSKKAQEARDRHREADEVLKTKDNFTSDPEPDEDEDEDFGGVEDPKAIVSNVLDSISGAKSLFEAWRKTFTASAFDREQKAQLYNAINLLITKLKRVQSTLDTKGQDDA